MLNGDSEMSDAISDTGPILHLHEIQSLESLNTLDSLEIPNLVAAELKRFELDPDKLQERGTPDILISEVDKRALESFRRESQGADIQPADIQVAVLALRADYKVPILTDDLALRKVLESKGGTVVGTAGVLVRAYKTGIFEKPKLIENVDRLFSESTLHMSSGFRRYLRSLVEGL